MSSSFNSVGTSPPDISRGNQYVAVQWALVSIAIVLVLFRLFVRGILRRKFGGDDYTILAALAWLFRLYYTFTRWAISWLCHRYVPLFKAFWLSSRSREDSADMFNTFNLRKLKISVEKAMLSYYSTSQEPSSSGYLSASSYCNFCHSLRDTTDGKFCPSSENARPSVYILYISRRPLTSNRCIYGVMLVFTSLTVPMILFICFQCVPVSGIWDRNVNARCVSPSVTTKIAQAHGGIQSQKTFP